MDLMMHNEIMGSIKKCLFFPLMFPFDASVCQAVQLKVSKTKNLFSCSVALVL